jgi:hypothetical protein
VLFWASLDGETIQVTPFDQQDFTLPPAFSRSGKEFLVISEGQLYRYEYPNGPLLAQMGQLAEDEHAGESICYLDDRHALMPSTEGKMFIVDVFKMKVVDEVASWARIRSRSPISLGSLMEGFYPYIAISTGLRIWRAIA